MEVLIMLGVSTVTAKQKPRLFGVRVLFAKLNPSNQIHLNEWPSALALVQILVRLLR